MKRSVKILIILIFIYLSPVISPQVKFSEKAQDYKTYFAVPDAPAFELLNTTSSNLLRPSSVKEIGIAFSNFLDDESKLTLPGSFALEFSPGLLINGKNLNLTEYNNNKLFYRFRVSFATNRTDQAPSAADFAFGFRITLNDESDLRSNSQYIKNATELSEKIQAVYDEKRVLLGPAAEPEMIEELPDVIEKKEKLIQEFTEEWSEEKWNSDISEIAFASKISSGDSLPQNLMFSKFSFWYSSAYGFGKWGQLLIGANANYERPETSENFKGSISISSRIYVGSNKYKVQLELQENIVENMKSIWLFNSGFEIKIEENIWAEFTAGIESNAFNNSSLITDFKFKYGL